MLWAPQEIVSDPFTVQIDPKAPEGIYYLLVGLYLPVGESSVSLPLSEAGQLSKVTNVRLGPILVGKTPPGLTLERAAPQIPLNQPLGAAAELTLLGYDLTDEAGRPLHNSTPILSKADLTHLDQLKLTLYWRVDAPLELDYTTFVHIRNAANETVFQQDQPPLNGSYPTSLWDSSELIADQIILPLSPDIPAGEYTIVIGMYNFDSGKRLPLSGSVNDELMLTSLEIQP
jgi:hypothetical protein